MWACTKRMMRYLKKTFRLVGKKTPFMNFFIGTCAISCTGSTKIPENKMSIIHDTRVHLQHVSWAFLSVGNVKDGSTTSTRVSRIRRRIIIAARVFPGFLFRIS